MKTHQQYQVIPGSRVVRLRDSDRRFGTVTAVLAHVQWDAPPGQEPVLVPEQPAEECYLDELVLTEVVLQRLAERLGGDLEKLRKDLDANTAFRVVHDPSVPEGEMRVENQEELRSACSTLAAVGYVGPSQPAHGWDTQVLVPPPPGDFQHPRMWVTLGRAREMERLRQLALSDGWTCNPGTLPDAPVYRDMGGDMDDMAELRWAAQAAEISRLNVVPEIAQQGWSIDESTQLVLWSTLTTHPNYLHPVTVWVARQCSTTGAKTVNIHTRGGVAPGGFEPWPYDAPKDQRQLVEAVGRLVEAGWDCSGARTWDGQVRKGGIVLDVRSANRDELARAF